MKFGYFTLTDNPPAYGADRRDPNQFLCEVLRECQVAEELGYNSAWVPEHHFGLFGCLPAPAVFLSHLAAQTTRIKLAPATVLLPCHHPLRVAEDFALLDLLSQGRTVFSAGRGYDKREYDAFATPFEESRDRFAEGLELLRMAWTHEAFTYHGRFYDLPEPVTCLPRPVQQPHPPIYVACFSRPTVEMAADKGFHTLFAPFAAAMMFGSVGEAVQTYKGLAAEAGHSDARAKCSYFVNVVDSPAEALQTKARLLRYLKSVLPAFPADRDTAPPHIAYFALLDLLSQGRTVFSAGRGYDKREYDAFATPFEESRDRFAEGLELLRMAWTHEAFTYHGRFYDLPEPVTCLPRPVQQPHPPIYVACFSRPTVEMAADKGFHTLFAPFAAAMMFGSVGEAVQTYKGLAAEAGHSDARAKCSYFVNVVDSPAEALQTKARLLRYLKSVLPAFPADRDTAPPHIAYFALLDLLSQGRTVFSAGRGYDKREYDAFATPFEESRDRFAEGLELLRMAWTHEAFTYHGRFYDLPEPVTCLPRPVQQPHPPIYVACFSRPTVEMAADKGFHTLFAPFAAAMMFGSVGEAVQTYKGLAAEAGHSDARAKCSYFVNVVDSPAEALQTKARLLRYLKSVLPAFPADRDTAPPHIAYFADIVERLQSMQPEQVGERSIVTGDPEACIATLKKCEAAGIEEVILYFNFGHFSHQDTLRSMERFARDVMPHFG